jgi:hypothetical protein
MELAMKSMMKRLFAVTAFALALAAGLATPANAQGAGKVSMNDIHVFAAEFGGSDGSVVATDAAGVPRVLAVGARNPVKYLDATRIPRLVAVSWCREEATTGFLYGCRAPDYPLASPSGGATEFECEIDEGGSYCSCVGALDCIEMITSGACVDGTLSCDEEVCVCEF